MARAAIIECAPSRAPLDSQNYHFKVVRGSGPAMLGESVDRSRDEDSDVLAGGDS